MEMSPKDFVTTRRIEAGSDNNMMRTRRALSGRGLPAPVRRCSASAARAPSHAKTLETIDAILGINRPKAVQDKPTDTTHPSLGGTPATSASVTGGTTSGDRIRGAINGATAQVDAHASQSQTRLSTEQRQMSIRPMPPPQGLDAPAQQAPPDFKATMTPEPNSN